MNKSQRIEKVLKNDPDTRNSDRLLIVRVWEDQGLVLTTQQRDFLLKEAISSETIRRHRQDVRKDYPSDPSVERVRQAKAKKHHDYHAAQNKPIYELIERNGEKVMVKKETKPYEDL